MLRRILERLPLLTVAVIALSLWLREWFPFSHFPMYARPSPSTYYVYLTDGNDEVLPIRGEFGVFAAALKKVHQRHLNQQRSRNIWAKTACSKTLAYALDYRKHRVRSERQFEHVKFWAARVTLVRGELQVRQRVCAEEAADEA